MIPDHWSRTSRPPVITPTGRNKRFLSEKHAIAAALIIASTK